jgi:hypothetical protein
VRGRVRKLMDNLFVKKTKLATYNPTKLRCGKYGETYDAKKIERMLPVTTGTDTSRWLSSSIIDHFVNTAIATYSLQNVEFQQVTTGEALDSVRGAGLEGEQLAGRMNSLRSKEKVVFVLHSGNHFTTLTLDITKKEATFFDSLGDKHTPQSPPEDPEDDGVKEIVETISKLFTPRLEFTWRSVQQMHQPDFVNCGLIAAVNAFCFLTDTNWPEEWIGTSSPRRMNQTSASRNKVKEHLNKLRVNFMNIFLATTRECEEPASKGTNNKEVEVVYVSQKRSSAASARSQASPAKGSASPARGPALPERSSATSAKGSATSASEAVENEDSPGFDEGDQLEQEEEISEEDVFSPSPRRPRTQIERAPCKIKYTTLIIGPYID